MNSQWDKRPSKLTINTENDIELQSSVLIDIEIIE